MYCAVVSGKLQKPANTAGVVVPMVRQTLSFPERFVLQIFRIRIAFFLVNDRETVKPTAPHQQPMFLTLVCFQHSLIFQFEFQSILLDSNQSNIL
jgi:hypothetical protein